MVWFIIALVVFGLICGGLARLLLPGPDPMGLIGTWALGIVGSFIGGFFGWLLLGADLEDGAVQTAGLLGSVIGAMIVLALVRISRRSSVPRRQARWR